MEIQGMKSSGKLSEIPYPQNNVFFCSLYKIVHAHCRTTTRQKSMLECKGAESLLPPPLCV